MVKKKSTRKPARKKTSSQDVKYVHVVKKKGHWEAFDRKKVFDSVLASALNCHYSEARSEQIAARVADRVDRWAQRHKHITTREIRDAIIRYTDDSDVALMYRHHLDLC